MSELLWTGTLPADSANVGRSTRRRWPRCRSVARRRRRRRPDQAPGDRRHRARRRPTGRRRGRRPPAGCWRSHRACWVVRDGGDVATRLAAAWRRQPSPQLVAAVSQALVLLADHELATSTLAVRVACSVRTSPVRGDRDRSPRGRRPAARRGQRGRPPNCSTTVAADGAATAVQRVPACRPAAPGVRALRVPQRRPAHAAAARRRAATARSAAPAAPRRRRAGRGRAPDRQAPQCRLRASAR